MSQKSETHQNAVRDLAPGYFAFVMATGIISVGLSLEGLVIVSAVLLAFAAVGYILLIVLTIWRALRYRAAFVADLKNPAASFQFFTFVAATNVLGTRFAIDWGVVLPTILLVIGAVTWIVAGYAIPWTVVLSRGAKPVMREVNGSWFIWAVASQSIAVLAAALEAALPAIRDPLSVFAIVAWGVGLVLYAVTGICVIIRLLLHGITPAEFGPAYWIAMGAAAITVLAGSRIVEMLDTPMVSVTRGLVAGGAVLLWSFASWLIPVLVAIGWWRHVRHKIPLSYEPGLWGIIFPLGMYAVAGIYLGQADHLPVVGAIGSAFLWVAILTWVLTTAGMLVTIMRPVRRRTTT